MVEKSTERSDILDISPEDYDDLASPFIEIPIGASGKPEAGDNCYLLVEVQANISVKTPGSSYQVPLMVIEEGINKGKIIDWYPGIRTRDAVGVTKRAAQAFGVADKVFRNISGKMRFFPDELAGAQAKAHLVRQWTTPQEEGKKPSLVAKLDGLSFLAVGEETPVTEELL